MSVREYWGMACPECGQSDRLAVAETMMVRLTPNGVDSVGDGEWSDQSPARCDECGWRGLAGDARIDKAPEPREALAALLAVMNEDKDGGWFVCAEAADIVDNANLAAFAPEPAK